LLDRQQPIAILAASGTDYGSLWPEGEQRNDRPDVRFVGQHRADAVIEGSGDFRYWHIASFRCAAEFGCYRGITDIGQAAPIKLSL
jgi:hypothetical protein